MGTWDNGLQQLWQAIGNYYSGAYGGGGTTNTPSPPVAEPVTPPALQESIPTVQSDLFYATPEMYGAKGDGKTDDTIAFTKALQQNYRVICMPGKNYYFGGIVDCSNQNNGCLDLNGSVLTNFHIKINLSDNERDWRFPYPIGNFIIKNGIIGSNNWGIIPTNWQTPAIRTGCPIWLENMVFQNQPYVMAIVDEYIDDMRFDNVRLAGGCTQLVTTSNVLEAITYIDKNTGTYRNLDDKTTGLAGDSWKFTACSEFRVDNVPSYGLVTTCRNAAITFINCIQSKVTIGLYSKVIFIGCHFEEDNTQPRTLENLGMYLSSATFIGCYFYSHHKLLDYPTVLYINCFFRCTYDDNRNNTLSYTMNDKSIYDLTCKLIRCDFGGGNIIDTEEHKRYKSSIKRTYPGKYENSISRISNTSPSMSLISAGANFSSNGTYTYDMYALPTEICNIANDYKKVSVNINNKLSMVSLFSINNFGGGYGFVVYRSHGTTIQKAVVYTPNDVCSSATGIQYRFSDLGSYAHLAYIKDGVSTNIPIPWVTVNKIDQYIVNNHVYETGGFIITTDGSDIENLIGITQIK